MVLVLSNEGCNAFSCCIAEMTQERFLSTLENTKKGFSFIDCQHFLLRAVSNVKLVYKRSLFARSLASLNSKSRSSIDL